MLDLLARSRSHEFEGIGRRDFLKSACLLAAAAVGMPSELAARMVQEVEAGRKPTVIWLSFQECTGCTETLLRTSSPQLDELLLDLINLAYHETLLAAAGHQAEDARMAAIEEYAGEYIMVVDGSIPTADNGIYCMIGGKTALEIIEETAPNAAALIAIGSCSAWGGIPSSPPNPTGAVGLNEIITDRPVVTIPGCPPNPYNFLGTVLQYATLGTLPELDEKGRPTFAYGRTIHEHCPRRAHFDAGRFAQRYGDAGHRLGWCLYELGCKGPSTYANCSVQHFNDVPDAWPIGIGHPCYGCTEEDIAFKVPLHATTEINDPTPPRIFPPITPDRPGISPLATGVAGAVLGGAAGAAIMASNKLSDDDAEADDGSGSARTEG